MAQIAALVCRVIAPSWFPIRKDRVCERKCERANYRLGVGSDGAVVEVRRGPALAHCEFPVRIAGDVIVISAAQRVRSYSYSY